MSNTQGFLFGVSQYTTWHQSFESDVETYAGLGAEAIEVCEFKIDRARTREQFDLLVEHSLLVTSVQATVHTVFPDTLETQPGAPSQRMALLRNSIESLAPYIPIQTPFIVNTGAAPNGNMRDGWMLCVDEFQKLSDFAAEHGMRIAIEPLSPTDINRNTFLWEIPRALDMIGEVDRENFGICIDSWNICQDPLLAEHVASCGDRIFAVQLSDWREPRIYADRYRIGDGTIDFAPLLSAIRSTGYDSAFTLEIFSPDGLPDSLWKADPKTVIGGSLESLRQAWDSSRPPSRELAGAL